MGCDADDLDFKSVARRDFLKTTGALGVSVSLQNRLEFRQFNDFNQNSGFEVEWEETFGGSGLDSLHSVAEIDDEYLAAGLTSRDENFDAWLVKVDSQGNQEWEQDFGGSDNDKFYSVTEASDGYLAAGTTESLGSEGLNGCLIEVDEKGNEKWKKVYGKSGWSSFSSVIEVGDGYLAAGQTVPSEDSSIDGWLLKVDSQGNEEWQQTFGGSNKDEFYSVTEGSNGYLAAGMTKSNSDGEGYGWLVKVDEQGNEKWKRTYGEPNPNEFSSVIEVDDGYLVAGDGRSSDVDDGWLVKVDSQGNEQWRKTFGGSSGDGFESVIEVSDGYLAAGTNQSKGGAEASYDWLVKVDDQGNEQWQQTYDGESNPNSLISITEVNGGYLAVGTAESSDDEYGDGWLMKLSNEDKKARNREGDNKKSNSSNNGGGDDEGSVGQSDEEKGRLPGFGVTTALAGLGVGTYKYLENKGEMNK